MAEAKQLAFFFDSSGCSGCKACQIACKDKNDLEMGLLWRRVVEIAGGRWIRVGQAWTHSLVAYHLSIACLHCAKPICAAVCPNRAIVKQANGIVWLDPSRCMGCRYCEWHCPYGAPRYDEQQGKMSKCDLCRDRVAQHQQPACVSACPMRSMGFGELVDLQDRYGKTATVFPLPQPSLTQPAWVVKPHPRSIYAAALGARIVNGEEVMLRDL